MRNPIAINLVSGRRPHILDKVFSWSLSIGRGLVIVTEVVALGAFIFRFSLDRQIIDLHQKIKQEQNIVSFWKKNEDTYRNLQRRLTVANQIIQIDTKTTKLFTNITSLIPPDLVVKNISFASDSMRLDGSMQSVTSLSKFVNQLKSYPDVTSVSLDQLEDKTTTATITVGITITFKKPQTIL